jgi:hypothetical protein
MTDVAYLCHNCGSVHEVESIRENLILDLRTAASYELSQQRGMLGPRGRFRCWGMTRGLAQALWPGISASSTSGLGPWAGAGAARARSDGPVTAGQQLVAANARARPEVTAG